MIDKINYRIPSGELNNDFSEIRLKQNNLTSSKLFKEDLIEKELPKEIHQQVNKKRTKYNKLNDANSFQTNIKYIEIKDGDKIWIYSLSNYNNNTGNASYKCSDTHCNGRGRIYIFENINRNNDNKFYLKNEHSIDYFEHNYIRQIKAKIDYETFICYRMGYYCFIPAQKSVHLRQKSHAVSCNFRERVLLLGGMINNH